MLDLDDYMAQGYDCYFFTNPSKETAIKEREFKLLLSKQLSPTGIDIKSITLGFFCQRYNSMPAYERKFSPSWNRQKPLYQEFEKFFVDEDDELEELIEQIEDRRFQYFSTAYQVNLAIGGYNVTVFVATKEDIELYLTEYGDEGYVAPDDLVFVASQWCQRCSYPGAEDGYILSIFSDRMSLLSWILSHAMPRIAKGGTNIPGFSHSNAQKVEKLKHLLNT